MNTIRRAKEDQGEAALVTLFPVDFFQTQPVAIEFQSNVQIADAKHGVQVTHFSNLLDRSVIIRAHRLGGHSIAGKCGNKLTVACGLPARSPATGKLQVRVTKYPRPRLRARKEKPTPTPSELLHTDDDNEKPSETKQPPNRKKVANS